MMKKLVAMALALLLAIPAWADEGMWLPMLLGRSYEDMKANGLQLTQEEIYSINEASLKDAIVSFGGFCTGEIISSNGLILTNHHCGFSAIQSHSTTENNYLDDGFWAGSYGEEKPNEGLFVRFLVRMEDVTERVNSELTVDMSESDRAAKIAEISDQIVEEATEENDYEANVKSFYHGNEFYLFIYEVFNDVRLVGAPPSSIGKFGGDTDNWMWPRHTGDFSLFRVYTAPDGTPAEYSEENIPMKPKHHLPISMDGVQEGDFTMVWGYPGSTDRYLSSYGVEQAINLYNPSVVEVRDRKLEIMKKYMQADEATRIQYASKYARVSNYWKYYIGQTEQLKKNNVKAKKAAIEEDFSNWATANEERNAQYGTTLPMLEEAYQATDPYIKGNVYVLEAGLTGSDLTLTGFRFGRFMEAYFATQEEMESAMKEAESKEDKEAAQSKYEGRMASLMDRLKAQAEEHFKNYNAELDKELFAELFAMYEANIPADQQPEFFATVSKKYKGDWNKFAEKVFESSIVSDEERAMAFFEDPDQKTADKDWAMMIGGELYDMYRNSSQMTAEAEAKMNKAYRLFTAGLREMNPEKMYYPDANSTMRMTYGTVGSYDARDAVFYEYYTTADGIMQKKDNSDPEFVVPEKLEKLIMEEDFGDYANSDGELPVCFIHNTDITGGNSGSPVINGKGELIGCAFDGNWEAMSGDIFFEDRLQRTISVDARYILFVIDKYAGAQNIIDELTLVKSSDEPAVIMDDENTEKPAEASGVMN
jgi:hypothetical protein